MRISDWSSDVCSSDLGLPDVAMTRWIQQQLAPSGPLVVVAAQGLASRFVQRMLDPYDDDLALRVEHVGAAPIEVALRTFAVPISSEVVWKIGRASRRESVCQYV